MRKEKTKSDSLWKGIIPGSSQITGSNLTSLVNVQGGLQKKPLVSQRLFVNHELHLKFQTQHKEFPNISATLWNLEIGIYSFK
jgi:hypothetical protein